MNMDRKIREKLPQIIEDIRSLVVIRSVKEQPEEGHPFGKKVSVALEETLKIGRRMGFRCCNLDMEIEHIILGIKIYMEAIRLLLEFEMGYEGSK